MPPKKSGPSAKATPGSTPRTKRALSPDKDEDRIQRKRAQNRISQQCVREKNLARAKQMQTLASVIKSSSREGENSTAALDAQLALIDENQKLRETLLQMRKKLLSLSTAASAAADDSIFEKIFGLKRRKRLEPSPESERIIKDDSSSSPPHQPLVMNSVSQGVTASDYQASTHIQSSKSIGIDTKKMEQPSAYYPNMFGSPDVSSTANIVFSPGMVWSPGKATEEELDSFNPMTASRNFFDFQSDMPLEGFDLPIVSPPSLSTGQVNFLRNDFSRLFWNTPASDLHKLEEACNVCISARLGIQPVGNTLGPEYGGLPHFDISKTNISTEEFERTVADVAAVGCELLSKMTGLESFLYGIGANEIIEKVLRWRLSPTLANRLAIPEPHRPTPLQYKTNCYPLSIDLLYWPSLRDQLILDYSSGASNLDEHIKDLFMNTVIDVPQFSVCINAYDVFLTRLLPRVGDKLSIWTHNNDVHGSEITTIENVDEKNLVPRMLQRVQEIEMSRVLSNHHDPPTLDAKPAKFTGPAGRTWQLAVKYGLHTQKNWKLHNEFARKYPLLDCSSVLSKYPLYSSALVPEF